MSCSRKYFRVCCRNRLTLKSQWIGTTDAYFSLMLPDQGRVKWVWKAGSAPHSHPVIQAEGGATTWSLASYHERTRLAENSPIGLPWWPTALPLQEAQVRSLAGEFCMPHRLAKKKKKKKGERTPVLYTLAQKGRPHFSPQQPHLSAGAGTYRGARGMFGERCCLCFIWFCSIVLL